MQLNVPIALSIFFFFTTVLCLFLVYKVLKTSNPKMALVVCLLMVIWLIIQAVLTLNDVYKGSVNDFPPKIAVLGILPTFLILIILFLLPKSRKIIESLSLESLAYVNIVRVPVEIALYVLFMHKAIPEIMTFAGRNFDILCGITSPLIVYFYKKGMSNKLLLAWHLICLGLLVNIVFLAIFSAETPFQKFGFDQPNLAIVHFPFSWLATYIVPIVLFAHLSSIWILFRK